jgi:Baseplate J-like protein
MSTGCNCDCGCSAMALGVPENTASRPGLPALAYRIGTHAAFFEAMIARLSSQDFPALARLTTRDPADPSIALLDSWALIADVLTFYQERIANEGYLRTAIERRSVLELARLIGYKLRPGVAASVFLAYTLDPDRSKVPPAPTETVIPAGSRSQSIPLGPPELPQSFETSADLDARSAWNNLRPRQTQPQLLTLDVDFGSDGLTRAAIYFQGGATNLNPGDPLLFVLPGASSFQPALRRVQSVNLQAAQNRTEIILQNQPLTDTPDDPGEITDFLDEVIQPFADDAATLFPGSSLAAQAGALLSNPAVGATPGLLEKVKSAVNKSSLGIAALVQATSQALAPLLDLAYSRNLSRLGAWLDQANDTLAAIIAVLQEMDPGAIIPLLGNAPASAFNDKNPPLGNLKSLLPSLVAPPSLQPLDSVRLGRSVDQAFAQTSDMGSRLLGTFLPAAAPILYRAWHSLSPLAAVAEAGAIRQTARLFPGAYPGPPTITKVGDTTTTTSFDNPPTIHYDWIGTQFFRKPGALVLSNILLDSPNDKIVAGSWVLIDRPNFGNLVFRQKAKARAAHVIVPPNARTQTLHKVTAAATVSRTTADGGFTAKITQLTIDPPWLSELKPAQLTSFIDNPAALSGTVVYAQTERLALAEEPLDTDVAGNAIELDEVYEDLESGRWIIVSGERTDIPNVTGVTASEVVMLLGVTQDVAAPGTRPGPIHTVLTLANTLAYTYRRDTVTIYGNVVKATHGETRNEVLGNGDGSQLFQQFKLKQKPLTFVAASNPEGTDSTLSVYVNNVEWQETDTLAALGPKDRDYITQTADDDTTTVNFGNGKQGARLPTGAGNVMAIYRNGIGQPGNVKPGQISLLQTRPLNVSAVTNPVRASGGADRDSRDQARRNAPLAVLALDRLVSVQDYADFARTFAGIGKASSVRVSDGRQDLVHLTIAGAEDIPIDVTSDLYGNLVLALQVNGDPYQPFQIAPRGLRVLVISANVKILADYLWEPVASAVRAALLATFSFDDRNLGQPVFQSEVISAIQAVEGVAYVDLQTFDSVGEDASLDDLSNLADHLGLQDVVQAQFARPNPNPLNYPDDAFLPAEIACLRPDLPDTLILNEVKS